jgi:hypothetical protein
MCMISFEIRLFVVPSFIYFENGKKWDKKKKLQKKEIFEI